MPNETTQPFSDQQPPRRKDDTELVGQVLGGQAADEMEQLIGKGAKSAPPATELGLSAEEGGIITEAEKILAEVRREEYYVWAEELGKNAKWVDETFTFEHDGTVIVDGDLNLSSFISISQMPPNLKAVMGYLSLNHLTSAEHLTFPISIGGDFWLNNITSVEHLTFPISIGGKLLLNSLSSAEHLILPASIGGDLYLRGLVSGFIPEGCKIEGEIVLNKKQVKIIADAKSKGYKVRAE